VVKKALLNNLPKRRFFSGRKGEELKKIAIPGMKGEEILSREREKARAQLIELGCDIGGLE